MVRFLKYSTSSKRVGPWNPHIFDGVSKLVSKSSSNLLIFTRNFLYSKIFWLNFILWLRLQNCISDSLRICFYFNLLLSCNLACNSKLLFKMIVFAYILKLLKFPTLLIMFMECWTTSALSLKAWRYIFPQYFTTFVKFCNPKKYPVYYGDIREPRRLFKPESWALLQFSSILENHCWGATLFI